VNCFGGDFMETIQKLEKITETSSMMTYRLKTKQTVRDILKELQLEQKYFAVLVNGRKAALNDVITENSEILILPRIAGG